MTAIKHSREVRLGELVESMKNGLYKPSDAYADDGYPCLRMYNIDSGKIVWKNIKRMRLTDTEFNDYRLDPGDLLVNRVNSRELVGKTAIIPHGLEPTVFESKNIRVRLKRDVADPRYVAYALLLKGRQHFDRNAQQVVGMASISQKQIADFLLPCPSLDEQRRIVAEIEERLSRLEAGVAALKRVQANLKRYRAAVLADAVCGKFRQIALGELARDAGYGTSVKCAYSPNGIGVLRIPNISSGKIDTTDMKRAPVDYAYKPDDPVEPGDLLIIRTNGSKSLIGRGAVVLEATPEPLLFASYLIRLRLNGTRTLWRWVSLALESPVIRAWIETKAASSAGQHNISLTILRSMPLPLPSASEQERILSEVDRRLSVVEELETQVHADLARSDRLRKATLQSAFQLR